MNSFSEKLIGNVNKVIVGKDKQIELLLVSLLVGGHVLLEDVPGTGKTKTAKALAQSLDLDFKRVQFTIDLLPSDLTGINFFDRKENDFVFRKGPIFTNILLADEINRATARTQSSLLECMGEKQVTVDGDTRKLDLPFLVIATQNPVESQGTFPLPEAQLDRFLMMIKMDYPTHDDLFNAGAGQEGICFRSSVRLCYADRRSNENVFRYRGRREPPCAPRVCGSSKGSGIYPRPQQLCS